MAILKEIWDHRNNIVYKDAIVDVVKIFENAQLKIWACIANLEKENPSFHTQICVYVQEHVFLAFKNNK